MEFNENLVTEEVTEKVDGTTTEETVAEQVTEPVRTYTDEEVNEIVGKKLARQEAKIRKEYGKKYGDLENVLRAGTGKQTVEEITDTLTQFYRGKGVEIPQQPTFSDKDAKVLAKADADEIIEFGFDAVVEEADRLNDKGLENMTAREKALFIRLTDHIKDTETGRELSKIGVTKDVYESDEFKNFASMFAGSKTPITKIYEIYNQTKPKKEIKTMGSMKQTAADTGAVKEFYTREEALKFTREDFKKTPGLLKAVENSMLKW